ncbi:HDOD domain-containing protein [Aquabacterium sp. A08]|uniref:HDOD domain-containing protein n=1 Tax=Aquabacterium sp. A08 TaxID=2718532 RepID=UPI001423E5F9|nr:HDOD domain-containing protein [Aquabacterium sp. A08]NIC43656.1 HDOD domain-containing protein [Aquabacterium sp. A08]
MSLNLLEHVAFAYQPIWGASRQLTGVRLRVRALAPDSVDAVHLLELLANAWSDQAPFLLVSFVEQSLLRQALVVSPHDNLWLEIPDFGDTPPPGLPEAVARAHRMGHRLVQDAPLARARPLPATGPGVHRYLLHLWPEQVVQAQQALAQAGRSPLLSGQLYRDLGQRTLAVHALDQRQAWGVVGWPEDDVLRDHARYGVPVDKLTLVRVQQALMREASMEVIERLIHQDAVLTFRMLRLVNSPVFGASREVTTIRQALMLLGQRRLRDWLLELMPGAAADRELLPVRLAMVLRGRLMEHLMDAGVQHDLATEIYVTGLFSRLDRLTQEPLTTTLRRVPLSEPMTDALLRQSGPYFPYFDIAQRLERFDEVQRLPAVCEAAGFPLEQVNRALLRTLAHWRNSL